jgi:hypothetical protein
MIHATTMTARSAPLAEGTVHRNVAAPADSPEGQA